MKVIQEELFNLSNMIEWLLELLMEFLIIHKYLESISLEHQNQEQNFTEIDQSNIVSLTWYRYTNDLSLKLTFKNYLYKDKNLYTSNSFGRKFE